MSKTFLFPAMTDELSRFDRLTLWFWRATNVIGWSMLGIWFALILHSFMMIGFYESIVLAPTGWGADQLAAKPTLLRLAYRLGVAVPAGCGIGFWVARKVWVRPPLVAMGAALVYLLWAIITLESKGMFLQGDTHRTNDWWRMLMNGAASGTTIFWAWWFARRVQREMTPPPV